MQSKTNKNQASKPGMLRRIGNRPVERELGFGRKIYSNGRLMNIDGSFNVRRQGVSPWDNTYFDLVTMPWSKFLLLLMAFFFSANLLFSLAYCAVGIENLNGIQPGTFGENLLHGFFFSSQTLTTVGYGHISPNGFGASAISAVESFMGLLLFALFSGLLYGRFSRQGAKIVFSEQMVVAPYKEGKALMFRMVNARRSELIESEVQLILSINETNEDQSVTRKFFIMDLEIPKISFFNMSWTLVHYMNENSPLHGFALEDLKTGNAEFMILMKGTDEANHQMVYARRSYISEEIIWDARFISVIETSEDSVPKVHTSRISEFELVGS